MTQNLEIPPVASTPFDASGYCRDQWPAASPGTPAAESPRRWFHEVIEALDPADGWVTRLLTGIQELTGAERVFLFDVRSTSLKSPSSGAAPASGAACPPPGELGDCVSSIDFDREQVSKPETKVPRHLLLHALKSGQAVWALNALSDFPESGAFPDLAAKLRGFAAVPLLVRKVCHAVVYLEHRFQAIQIGEAKAEKLLALLRAAGLRCALEKLENENRSLWLDLLNHREKLASARIETAAPAFIVPAKHAGGRHQLLGDYRMIIGSSQPMMEIFQLLERIQSSKAAVLINGDSGTGKELIANAIHKNSPRRDANFVSENCGALTETLLESELFGYVRGAFTGANREHKGLFELASGGTLFLDEVGDMSPAMQKKLLRAIQEEKIRRVGGQETIPVDVRLISATNKDLLQEVRQGNFREDLYYRLNVINILLPALRQRREDIPELVYYFLGQLNKETGLEKTIAPQALQLLIQYDWPGNIRELQNELKRLFALSDARIEVANLSPAVIAGGGKSQLLASFEKEFEGMALKDALDKVERALVKKALLDAHGNKSQVAKALQIPKTSLYNKITKYQLDKEIQETLFD